ncbi:FAD-binding protein [Halanaerobium salsuginis]|jgi:succinate dehydrogenase/fumarate reductase flavoprotein subunit|uniref:Succinate dehydrogenase/fumarate reductase, flavoprotein subunit n=1 Tax=Halanaerobium salsuginis TaxID=29563 RepID=A0A1I4HWI5_9FIRM|nr:FAD-binding protein [Halanaerobium salsuginis]SFL46230.1 Succinate dehydrogenase/fumarate reductase, flavoprotein subunit [Halanaerobium salsuginis]
MKQSKLEIGENTFEVYSLNTIIIGSGAAGLNAALRLHNFGQQDIAVVTEGLKMGTSRNTGSDKQTYYKLTLGGGENDSVLEMARTLFAGGSMDGDLALVEAALSARSFYNLVELGVPFPHNTYGEYVGYKTDHDPRKRATSAGPLTSHYMTEKLEAEVKNKEIKIFDNYQVIAVLTDQKKQKAVGVLTLNKNNLTDGQEIFTLFNTKNIVYATGGPAGLYKTSVYPGSQTGASGLAFEAGVSGKNLTEWQYGIASTKFRWNLSGTYQQVLPTYISTDQEGKNRREFLADYFSDPGKMLDAIFLKGYQWPFDPRKVSNYGSSLIDILVYHETVIKGRRVWLDYRQNAEFASQSGKLNFDLLGEEAARYLINSEADFGTPITRLAKMNQPAIDLYQQHNIDLKTEMLEIAVCAQHNNGGLAANLWWESNLKHFFPVGEVNGSHGIYRPGGTALNSGQVGSTRAAQYIAARYQGKPLSLADFISETELQLKDKLKLANSFVASIKNSTTVNVIEIRQKIGQRMSQVGAHIRSLAELKKALEDCKDDLDNLAQKSKLSSYQDLKFAFQNYDLLLAQYVYLTAFKNYIEQGGKSRGSYLIKDPDGQLPLADLAEKFRFSLDEDKMADLIQEVNYNNDQFEFKWRPVREIPTADNWFEKVWSDYLADQII